MNDDEAAHHTPVSPSSYYVVPRSTFYLSAMPSRISEGPTAAAVGVAPSAPAPAPASAADDDTSITLTFNGVSFRLTPDQSSSSSCIANNNDGDEANIISFLQGLTGSGNSAQLALKNFTGTLQVELAATTTTTSTSSARSAIATSSPINTSSTAATTAGGASRVTPESTAANKASNSPGAAADEPSSILGHNNTADDSKSPAHKTPQRAASTTGAAAAKSKTKQQGLLPFASASTASSTAGAKKKTNNSKTDAKSAIAKARAGGGSKGKSTPAKRNASRSAKKSSSANATPLASNAGKLSLTRQQKKQKKDTDDNNAEDVGLGDESAVDHNSSLLTPIAHLGQTALSMPTQQVEPSQSLSQSSQLDLSQSMPGISQSTNNLSLDQMPDDNEEEEEGETQDTTMMMDAEDVAVDGDDDATSTAPSSPIVQKGKHHPEARWGQTMTLIDHGRILVYGGQTFDHEANSFKTIPDIHVYDMSTRKWSKPVSSESVPRTWHSATFLPERQLLISFGGDQWDEKTKKVVTTDEVMVLDTDIMLWYPPSVSGQIPSGRSGHTASLLPNTNELVVFGGVKNNKWQNSVAVLDTSRWKWTNPKISGSAPRPRSYHSATAVGGSSGRSRLVIFGGNDEAESFNTVHVLDASNSKLSWFHPVVSGTPPSARSGHTATLLEDNKTILIYGGWDLNADEDAVKDDADMLFSDSYLLDTEQWSWSDGPKVKYDGSSGVKNGGPKRVGHSAVLAPSEDCCEVLVFGGRVPNDEFTADFQRLTVPQKSDM